MEIIGMACAVVAVTAVLAVVLAIAGARNANTEAVQPAWKAYVAVESATQVGVNFTDYGTLVRNFATQVNLVSGSKLTEKERRVTASLLEALAAHQRAIEIWRRGIESLADIDETALQSAWADAGVEVEYARSVMAPASKD